MANETPNRLHAGGMFVPVVAPPFAGHVLNQQGVKAFERLGVGQYLVTLQRALAFHEGYADAALPANFQAIAGAQLSEDGTTVLVTVLSLGTGAPVDPPLVACTVWSVREGDGKGPGIPFPAIPPPLVSTRVVFAGVDENANEENYRVRQVSSVGNFNFSFSVPDDFVTLLSVALVCTPLADLVNAPIDLASDYGAQGEPITNTQEASAELVSATGMEWGLLDLSPVFSVLAAGDYCGVNVDHNGLSTSVDYMLVRLEYALS